MHERPDPSDRTASGDPGPGTWPLTYLECRERFRWAAGRAGATPVAHPIEARGPAGEELTIDVAHLGSPSPRRALLLTSGVHGIEGYAGSMIQSDLLQRLAADPPAWGDTAVLLIHAVNPWGMAWWRRANEHNVDLNRNWQDFSSPDELLDNDGYGETHPLLCPGGDELPETDRFVAELARLADERGLAWVQGAIAGGQYSHPDGLYFGGRRREPSTELVERIVIEDLAGTEAVLGVDLHTGHGRWGTYTLLSRAPRGGEADRWIRSTFDADRVETTVDPTEATTVPKAGQLVPGALARLDPPRRWAVTFELGTRSEMRVIVAERAEHWVHRRGDRLRPEHRGAIWEHRICSIPDSAEWERRALAHGRTVVDRALAALPTL